jgi:lysozyme
MISQREFTEQNEGRKYKVYKCTGGANTIGIGHNIDAKGLPSDIEKYLKQNGKILDEHIDRLYIIDEGHAVSDCKKLFPNFKSFSHNRKVALTEVVCPLGYDRASKFVRSIHLINIGAWEEAADNMLKSLWAKQTTNRAIRVTELLRDEG